MTIHYRLACAVTAMTVGASAHAEEAVELGNVVVTASGFEQQIKQAPASISVVTREDLAKKSYRDVTDALRDIPGVVITGGASSSDISIRGMASKYSLILIDGKRMESRATRPNSDGPGIEQGWTPPLEAIERIEVVRGPMSSLYGSDAMGGVINIITRKVSSDWHGGLRTEHTFQDRSDSGDYRTTNGYLSGPLVEGLLGMQVYGQTSRRDEDDIPRGFNEQKTDSGTAKLSFTPNAANDLVLEVGRTEQERNSSAGKSGTGTDDSLSDYNRTHYAITHTGRWSLGQSETYLQQERIENPGRDMTVENSVFNTQTSLYLGNHITTLGGQYRYEDLTDKGNQLAGAEDVDRLTRWSWALFAEDEWSLTDSFALTTGLRMDRDENYGTHWSPRVYGVWQLAEQWTVKGGVSSGYRSPDIRAAVDNWGQITGGGRGDPAVIVGNSALKPEKSLSQEIGVLWDNLDGLSAGVTLFNTDFEDKITELRRCTDTTGNASGQCVVNGEAYRFISDRVNVDEARMRGVEATFDWAISETVSLGANYTYTESEQRSGDFKGEPLNQMPKHMFNTTIDWQASDRLGTWARVNYRSETSEYLSRVSMADSTPAYTLVDVGGTYDVTRNLKLLGGVYNLFNEQIDYDSYGTILDGRRFTVGASLSF